MHKKRSTLDEFANTGFYIKTMRQQFESRHKEPCIQRTCLLPNELEQPEKQDDLNIRSLLLTQPKNVESECKFHTDLFSKFKFNFIQSSWKLAFVNKLLQVPAEFPNTMDLEAMESKTSFHKATLQENKALADKLKNEIYEFIQDAYTFFENGKGLYKENVELMEKIVDLQSELDLLCFNAPNTMTLTTMNDKTLMNSPMKDTTLMKTPKKDTIPMKDINNMDKILNEYKMEIQSQKEKQEMLFQEIQKWNQILESQSDKNSSLSNEITSLIPIKTQLESQAAQALKASKNKDVQFEDLCKWYTEVNSLLYKIRGIACIRNLSKSEFELDYELDSRVIATLFLKVNHQEAHTNKGLVNAKIKGMNCPIQDIVLFANKTFKKMDQLISFIVYYSRSRIYQVSALESEMSTLIQNNDSIMYDSESRQVLVHAESGRTFVIYLKQGYPATKWEGMEIIGIEPALEGDSEVELWQDKLISNQVESCTRLVSMLE